MKRVSAVLGVLALAAAPLAAQTQTADASAPPTNPAPSAVVTTPSMPADFFTGTFSLAGAYSDVNRDSSKWLEYRDLPDGPTAPAFRLQGRSGEATYDLAGQFVRPEDQRYSLRGNYRSVQVDAVYNRIPHRFGFGGSSLLDEVSPGVFRIDDARRTAIAGGLAASFAARPSSVNFALLNGLVSAAGLPYRYDLELLRDRGKVDLNLSKGKPVELTVSYFREGRSGTRAAAGTSFGFGNVVETPEPIDYTTQDMSARAEYTGSWGVLRGVVRYNWFDNAVNALTFDNPFRLTDSVHASAYQAPSATTIDGARFAMVSLPPSNDALTGSVGGVFKLPGKTRVSADVTVGRWTQDEQAFLPYTTNTAMAESFQHATGLTSLPTSVSALPAQRLDGKADILSMSYSVVSRPVKNVTLSARYRYYDFDNKTSAIELPGYARFDAVWEEIPRRTVPYSFGNDRLEATAAYDFDRLTLEAGYKRSTFDRTFRETEETVENAFVASANLRTSSRFVLRSSYERAVRDFAHYDGPHSEHASYIDADGVANMLALDPADGGPIPGRYDQAQRTFDRVSAMASVVPHDKVSFTVGYLYAREDFGEDLQAGQYQMGLAEAKYDVISADLGFTPTERVSLYGFYTRENNKNDQIGRQSGATVSVNPLDNWTSNVSDKTDTYGAGATLTLVPDKWTLDVSGRYQKTDGFNDIDTAVTGAAGGGVGAVDLVRYDDTEVTALNGELRYQFQKNWTAALGGLYEDYKYEDDNSIGDLPVNYLTGSLFLNAYDGAFSGKMAYFRLSYRW